MKKINLISWAVVTLFAAAFVSSCNKEEDHLSKLDNRYVNLTVKSEAGIETKSNTMVQTSKIFKLSENGVDLFVTASRTVNNESPFNHNVSTKGAIKTADDISEGFSMYMYKDEDGSLYKSGIVKSESSSATYWSFYDGAEKIAWPEDAEEGKTYSFVSCIGDPSMTISDYTSRTVTYKGLAHTEGSLDEAKRMQDLIVAYTAGVEHNHRTQNLVNLNFYHPLAAVRFHVSDKVKKITLQNVKKGGVLHYNAVNPEATDAFMNAFTWDELSEADSLTTYTQAFSADSTDLTFFLVPQVFNTQDVMLTFNVEVNGQIHQITTKANNLGCDAWEAGYIYNYYINESEIGKVGIQIDENFTNSVKSNVVVTNTKRSSVFLRATIVANWCSASGRVIESYEFPATAVSSNWSIGSDGYYYYPESLVSFASTRPIIETFSNPENTSHAQQHLVVTIAAQAVEADAAKTYATTAWASANGTSPTVGGKTLVEFFTFK